MRESLLIVAKSSEEGFKKMAKNMPRFVNMKMESKLSKNNKGEPTPKPKKEEKPLTWDEEYGELAKHFRL